jgi:hypothetical protein
MRSFELGILAQVMKPNIQVAVGLSMTGPKNRLDGVGI